MCMSKIHYCNDCGIELDVDNQTKIPHLYRCRECYNIFAKKRGLKLKFERDYWGQEVPLYGLQQVRQNPGEYVDDEQRKHVADILEAIGWKHNPKKDIWYDDKIKDKNGKWFKTFQRRSTGRHIALIRSGKIQLPTIQIINNTIKRVITQEEIPAIQNDFFKINLTIPEIEKKYPHLPQKDIMWVIQTTYKRIRHLLNEITN